MVSARFFNGVKCAKMEAVTRHQFEEQEETITSSYVC